MTPRQLFYDAFYNGEYSKARDVMKAHPDELGYLGEMLYRVWSYTDGVTMEQMGLGKEETAWG